MDAHDEYDIMMRMMVAMVGVRGVGCGVEASSEAFKALPNFPPKFLDMTPASQAWGELADARKGPDGGGAVLAGYEGGVAGDLGLAGGR